MIDREVQRVAAQFWAAADGPRPFPRDLEEPIAWALPLVVAKLPRLWVRDAEHWLARRAIPHRLSCPDRPLHGCLVAHAGRGCVLLDGTDPPAERRFTLAHETAHFLLDYHHPRQHAVARLGAGVVEVFDGLRPPTTAERVDALLAGAMVGVHTHLMERRADGTLGCGDVLAAETRADRLALELLAPGAAVRARLDGAPLPARFDERLPPAVDTLVRDFGLPPAVAAPYARALVRAWFGGPTVRERLGLHAE